jgi:hypothetical protein
VIRRETMGEKLESTVTAAPEIMAELISEFIKNKDLKSRIQVRLRIKALLDLLSVDTTYPALPPDAKPSRHGGPIQPAINAPRMLTRRDLEEGPGGEQDEHLPPEVSAIPGAREATDNELVLGNGA